MAQVWQASHHLQPIFAGIDQLISQNLRRVQSAMQRHRVGPHHFSGSTGYGHGDLGREAFDLVSSLLSPVVVVRQDMATRVSLLVYIALTCNITVGCFCEAAVRDC